MERKNCVTFAFINFFSIYLGWVSCFYFCKITFFIAGNAPLILKISNYKTDIILFLYVSCFFFLLCAFIYNFIVDFYELHLSPQLSCNCSISFIVKSTVNGNYNFVSNNVKGIKASKIRLKLFAYLKNNINNNGFIFLQEKDSWSKEGRKWKDDFRGPLFS